MNWSSHTSGYSHSSQSRNATKRRVLGADPRRLLLQLSCNGCPLAMYSLGAFFE
jgi:hypothetical protein